MSLKHLAHPESLNIGAPLHIAPGAAQTCRQCAESCRRYLIVLSEAEARRLDHSIWRAYLHEVPDDLPLVIRHGASWVLNKHEGRCVFLGPDNLCEVHRHGGEEAKPFACRLFPWQLIQSPRGIHVSLMASCHMLDQQQDVPLLQPAELTPYIKAAPLVATIPEFIPLTTQIAIDFQTFEAYQQHLHKLLVDDVDSWDSWRTALARSADWLLTIGDSDIPTAPSGQLWLDTLRGLQTDSTQSLLKTDAANWLSHSVALPAQNTLSEASLSLLKHLTSQYINGMQAALYHTARTGWVALLGLHVLAVVGYHQHPNQNFNLALVNASALIFSRPARLALTEPNQRTFLESLT